MKKIALWLSAGLFVLLAGCAGPRFVTSYPLEFETAINTLAEHLLSQVEKERKQAKIVLDPFVDANSGEVVQVSRAIEALILQKAAEKFKGFQVERLAPRNLDDADYVLNGTIYLDGFRAEAGGQYYRVLSSLVELKTGKVSGNADIWVSNLDLDYTPTAFYQDSPTYLKDKPVSGLIATAKGESGDEAQKDYYDTLPTAALLVEASTLYEERDYQNALRVFEKTAGREDGRIMRTYAGLYETHYKLGAIEQAEKAFGDLLQVSVDTHKNLNIKFLFEVNSTEFIADQALRKQYALWLRQIALFFGKNQSCFQVVGHSSRSGGAAYNEQLSLVRAKRVQRLLNSEAPSLSQRSKAVGKGFRENLVGAGTDDARDAIDRRVELLLTECADLWKAQRTMY
jgi:outer membrane protein OmpA-like peptidoglycan-associated protein